MYHDCATKYMTATRVLTGGILNILNLSEILPVIWQTDCCCICQLQLSATNTIHLSGFRGL